MVKMKFSKDPKVRLVSLEEFLNNCDYFIGLTKKDLWTDKTIPSPGGTYYKITPNYLIYVWYDFSFTNFGMDIKEKLIEIQVAYRDGKTEYELFDNKLLELQNERATYKRNKKLDAKIEGIIKSKKLLKKYKEKSSGIERPYESYLIDTGYKTQINDLKNKYIVFDVETNGVRKSNDDLLSLSIYDPTTGMCYNR